MNLYFIDQPYTSKPIAQLSQTKRHQAIGPGDIAFFPMERRLIMVVLNTTITSRAQVKDFPMVAQILLQGKAENNSPNQDLDYDQDQDNGNVQSPYKVKGEEELLDLRPILYFNDNYSKTIHDLEGLKRLQKLFHKHKLASKLITETVNLLYHKLVQRDGALMKEVLSIRNSIPGIQPTFKETPRTRTNDSLDTRGVITKDSDYLQVYNKAVPKAETIESDASNQGNKETSSSGKLYVVEKHFSARMRKEFYEKLALGYSEKEAMLAIKRSHSKMFLKIHDQLQREGRDFYSRL